jgi:3-hydroxyisobutyrate dehydrogenase-like beta-hydroxyacid dehydrogenase
MITVGACKVGIVGTGEMGRPLVDRLLAAGHLVHAYARHSEARTELTDAGVIVVDDVAALGAGCDIVVVYVYSDDQVRSVALDDGLVHAMAPGSVLVIHATGSPATARTIAEVARRRGVGVLDAAGSGGPADVAAGRLNLFVGGTTDDLATVRPVFDAYASAVTHFGPVGSGQMVKLVNNLLFGCHIELALEAVRLAASFGVDEVELARTLHTCSGQSYSLDLVATMGGTAMLLAGAGRFVHKDVLVARQVAHEAGVELGSLDAVALPLLARTRPPDDTTEAQHG